jgi:signal peptidase II
VAGRTRGSPLWIPFATIAAVVVVLDQLTKAWIVARLAPYERMTVVGDYLRLVHGKNNGAVFGLFQQSAVVFGIVSLVVIALILAYHARAPRSPYLTVTLALLAGGAIGNLIDRLRLGYVVDFVDAGIGDVRFYTFNVADASISASVVLLILVGLVPALATLGTKARRGADEGDGA